MKARTTVLLARTVLAMAVLTAIVALQWPVGHARRVGAEKAPVFTVSPVTAAPNAKVMLQGSGWPANTQFGARMYETSNPNGPSASMGLVFQTDAAGNFSVQATVPNTLFGQGSRGSVIVVPGNYTVDVSNGSDFSASAPLTVGAPTQGGMLWGQVAFDSNLDRRLDTGDASATWIGVTITDPNGGQQPIQAITDARGHYIVSPIAPGSYKITSTAQFQGGNWTGSTTATTQNGQALEADVLLRPAPVSVAPERYFAQTGFAVDNDTFWDYFNKRGGIRTFGYPVSRTFQFLGFTTQFFQREVMQIGPDGNARTMNLLDPGLMPYTRINGSQFPAVDLSVKAATPTVGSSDYADRVISFVQQHAPNDADGQHVGFFDAFTGTVRMQDAFPNGGGDLGLLPLLNLEIWGVPTSNPTPDPTNSNFFYLRFQRGILHFQGLDANGNPITEGILLGDWFKSLITGRNLPADLEQEAKASNSPFLRQYDPSKPGWMADPTKLPNTDLTFAFEPQ